MWEERYPSITHCIGVHCNPPFNLCIFHNVNHLSVIIGHLVYSSLFLSVDVVKLFNLLAFLMETNGCDMEKFAIVTVVGNRMFVP